MTTCSILATSTLRNDSPASDPPLHHRSVKRSQTWLRTRRALAIALTPSGLHYSLHSNFQIHVSQTWLWAQREGSTTLSGFDRPKFSISLLANLAARYSSTQQKKNPRLVNPFYLVAGSTEKFCIRRLGSSFQKIGASHCPPLEQNLQRIAAASRRARDHHLAALF